MKYRLIIFFYSLNFACFSQTNIQINDNKNGFKITFVKANRIKSITIDEKFLKGSVKQNLISNSFKFNQKGQLISKFEIENEKKVKTNYEYKNDSLCKVDEIIENDTIDLITEIHYNENFTPQRLIKSKITTGGKIIECTSYEYEYDRSGLLVGEVINYSYSNQKKFIIYVYNDLRQKIEIIQNGRTVNKLFYNKYGKLSRNIIYHNALLTDSSIIELEYSKNQLPLKEKFIGNKGRIYSWHEYVYNIDNRLVEFYNLKSNGKIKEWIIFKYSKDKDLLIEEQHFKRNKMFKKVEYYYEFFSE